MFTAVPFNVIVLGVQRLVDQIGDAFVADGAWLAETQLIVRGR
jgi:hypothetical protein